MIEDTIRVVLTSTPRVSIGIFVCDKFMRMWLYSSPGCPGGTKFKTTRLNFEGRCVHIYVTRTIPDRAPKFNNHDAGQRVAYAIVAIVVFISDMRIVNSSGDIDTSRQFRHHAFEIAYLNQPHPKENTRPHALKTVCK